MKHLALLMLVACKGPTYFHGDAGLSSDSLTGDATTPDAMLDAGKTIRPGACATPIVPNAGVQTAREKGATCGQLGYYEFVPATYEAHSNWPLIIEFHGDGERGNGTTDLPVLLGAGLPQQIAANTWDPQKRFVVLSPQMDDRNGLPERTGPYVDAFIAFAVANYDVDPQRIYLTGYSGGAEPIYNYLGYKGSANVVAAVLPISGWYSTQNTECTWDAVPIWYFHGAADTTVPPAAHSTASYDHMVACNPPIAPRYTMYANRGHDDWNLTFDLTGMNATSYPITSPGTTPYNISLYDWFLQYAK